MPCLSQFECEIAALGVLPEILILQANKHIAQLSVVMNICTLQLLFNTITEYCSNIRTAARTRMPLKFSVLDSVQYQTEAPKSASSAYVDAVFEVGARLDGLLDVHHPHGLVRTPRRACGCGG